MNILITGAKGFMGQNFCAELKNIRDGKTTYSKLPGGVEIMEYDSDTGLHLLDEYCRKADFVFNLAGVNRPKDSEEFMNVHFGFTSTLLDTLKKHGNSCPVVFSSSIQAILDNPYGKSKLAAEQLLRQYGEETGAKVIIYRFTNLFGKWCRPNYNSVVATFCNNIANDLPVTVSDPETVVNLAYIDDVVKELISTLTSDEHYNGEFAQLPKMYSVTLGRIAELLYEFKNSRNDKSIPDMSDPFTKKLHATYLSYLPKGSFSYPLRMNIDDRGSFTEIIRTADRGQFSVNISKPHITKGQHWHHTKNEKFCVVSGKGVIRFRKIDSEEVIEYFVSGDKIEVVDIPSGYAHNIENIGETDMVTFMWCNEPFDPEHPDTYFLTV